MNTQVFSGGKRVRITRHGPCFGLCGTVLCVSVIRNEEKKPVCWYLIRLQMREESLWFTHREVEPLDVTPFAVQVTWP